MKRVILLLLLISQAGFSQNAEIKPIKIIAKYISSPGCDKYCTYIFEVLKVVDNAGYQVQDTIYIQYLSTKSGVLTGTSKITIKPYAECGNASGYYVFSNNEAAKSMEAVTGSYLIPKQKVLYTIVKPCETSSIIFDTYCMESPMSEKFMEAAAHKTATTDTAIIKFDLDADSQIIAYHISNKMVLQQSQMVANKIALQIFGSQSKTGAGDEDGGNIFGCKVAPKDSIDVVINFKIINIQ